ncbi:KGGVGR-motif variant AAA ATPase [Nocardiopsis sp. CA-288880]|uniref:MinD/ParA family ATP-binding protein n=1 Tax=Nocardiopsis sp. CA-288880 TaxID=3239995 RepID=UPI003D981D7C
MVSSAPVRLYTWVDVEERLSELALGDGWPTWLLEVDAWWDGLQMEVVDGTEPGTVLAWLEDEKCFGPGSVSRVGGAPALLFDGPSQDPAPTLPIEIGAGRGGSDLRRLPRLRERRIVRELADPLPRPGSDQFVSGVQVLAFHSFKGGVGRTLHAVALADHLARRGSRVLLVDADLEAPGITWMYQEQGGQMDFAYEDFLASLHGSVGEDRTRAVALAASYLPNQQIGRHPGGGAVLVLPASRRGLLTPPRIDPGDLLTPDRSRYFVSEALAELAESVRADVVIVDLRAGSSELSAPLLLDPRIQRVFVTTLSGQSLSGTARLIRQLGRRAPSVHGTDPVSSVVITQFRHDAHREQVEAAQQNLSDALADSVGIVPEESVEDKPALLDTDLFTPPLLSPFNENLLALPPQWDGVVTAIERSELRETLSALVPEPPVQDAPSPEEQRIDVRDRRRHLASSAEDLVYAENQGLTSATGFLATEPLRRLVGDHRTEPPIALVLGAKGAGKTFTYAKACAAREWRRFAEQSDVADVTLDASIVPVLEPDSLQQNQASLTTQTLRDTFAEQHGGTAATTIDIRDTLSRALSALPAEDTLQWRSMWLRCLAMAAGADVSERSPEDALVALGGRVRAVFVIDGLEDLLQKLDSEVKRTALRTLLIDTLNWLRALRGRPLGIIAFVRRDLVNWAVQQNSSQLAARYKSYALRWDSTDALRLTVWIASQAGALDKPGVDISDIAEDDLPKILVPLWGWKMGSEKSREARSHLWVPAALADYNKQVQARDVTAFLAESAKLSQGSGNSRWTDRVLAPSAMRTALARCSQIKIDAIKTENQDIGKLLARLQSRGATVTVPFTLDDVGLTTDEADALLTAGVFYFDDSSGRYRVPEIYRHGLGFNSSPKARVLNPWGPGARGSLGAVPRPDRRERPAPRSPGERAGPADA